MSNDMPPFLSTLNCPFVSLVLTVAYIGLEGPRPVILTMRDNYVYSRFEGLGCIQLRGFGLRARSMGFTVYIFEFGFIVFSLRFKILR